MRVVAVDWSGSRNPAYQRRHIWRADAVDGEITLLRGGRTRDEVVTELLEQAANGLQDLVVGFDFGFSVPRWYLDQLGRTAPDLWASKQPVLPTWRSFRSIRIFERQRSGASTRSTLWSRAFA